MKKLILLGMLAVAAGGTALYFGLEDDERQAVVESKAQAASQEVDRANDYLDKFAAAKTADEVRLLLGTADSLPKHLQDKVVPAARLRLAILGFQEAEKLLDRARALQMALSPPPVLPQPDPNNPMAPLPPPQPPPIHPLAMELFQKAIPLYEESKKEADRAGEIKGDDKYNYLLNYSKGEIYHRYLMLFATEETAPQLLAQTVTYYKHALRYRPGDTNTVINIELLIKDTNGGGGQGPQQQRNKLLNQQPGVGRSKGN